MQEKRAGKTGGTGLNSLRDSINECDRQINRLLVERFELVKQVGKYKASNNLPVLDESREKEVLAERRDQTPPDVTPCIEEIFRLILHQSRLIQKKIRSDS